MLLSVSLTPKVSLLQYGKMATNLSAPACEALCAADAKCSCVVYCSVSFHDIAGIWVAFFSRWHRYHCQQERKDCKQSHGVCWKRAQCDPEKFEKDAATVDFDTYFKNDQPPLPPPPPPPPPSHSHGALAYMKHDSMGPRGDAAILVFNPGPAQKLTIDLSMLPGE